MRRLSGLQTALYCCCAALCMCLPLEARQSAVDGVLVIGGAVPNPRRLSFVDIAKLPHRSLQVKESDGKITKFDGVPLGDLLGTAGVEFGETLRGARLASYLVVKAADGYRAVFALPELDAAFADRQIILADRRDGKAMTAPEGPLRIVAPDEKRRARWVRQVTALTILNAPDDSTKERTNQ